jgi:hypothetical protein
VIPIESFAHTLLANAADVTVERASLHHVRWSASESGRPDVFTEADLPELLSSGRFFARKFGEGDEAVLSRLEQHVLGLPPTVQEEQVTT